MRLIEIKNIHETSLYERVMEDDEFLEEGAKELFAAGKKKLGQAAEKLKDATDAPAQKAWAEVQSRLATAGKDDAIGKLKAFASKNKVAIGTLAIIGAGLLFSGDASAADVAGQAAGMAGQAGENGGDLVMSSIFNSATQAGIDPQEIADKLNNLKLDSMNGMGAQDYADKMADAANNANNNVEKNGILKKARETIMNALQQSMQGGQDASQSADQMAQGGNGIEQMSDGGTREVNPLDTRGRKVNWSGKANSDMMNQIKTAANSMRGKN